MPGQRKFAALVALLLLAGCGAGVQPGSKLFDEVPGTTMSIAELRIRTRALAAPLSGELEALTDGLAEETNDPEQRRKLLEFKSESINQLQSALFRPDPVAAIIDSWALIAQLQDMVQRLPAESAFGQRVIAKADARFARMEQRIQTLWQQLTGKRESDLQRQVHEWAAKNPIGNNLAARPSTTALVARLTARSGIGLRGTLGAFAEKAEDLVARVDLHTAYVPKQARWQAEYLVRDLLADPTLLDSPGAPAALNGSLERLTVLAEGLPGVLARERAALHLFLERERLGAQEFVSSERGAVLDAMAGERRELLAALDEQRRKTATDVDRIGAGFIDQGFDQSLTLVDRLLLRLLVLLMALALLAFAAGWWWRQRGARRLEERHA